MGFIALPGGFGTMDELLRAITLIQTHKLVCFPIVLVSKDYWQGFIDWINKRVLYRNDDLPFRHGYFYSGGHGGGKL